MVQAHKPPPISRPVAAAIKSAFQARLGVPMAQALSDEVLGFKLSAEAKVQPATRAAELALATPNGKRLEQRMNAMLDAVSGAGLILDLKEIHLPLTDRGWAAAMLKDHATNFPARPGTRAGVPGWTQDTLARANGTIVAWHSKKEANEWVSIASIGETAVKSAEQYFGQARGLYFDDGSLSASPGVTTALLNGDIEAPNVASAIQVVLHELHHAMDPQRRHSSAEGAAQIYSLAKLPGAMKTMGASDSAVQSAQAKAANTFLAYPSEVRGWSQLAEWAGHSLNTREGQAAVGKLIGSTKSQQAWDRLVDKALQRHGLSPDQHRNGIAFGHLQFGNAAHAAKLLQQTESANPLAWLGITDATLGARKP